MEIFSHTYATTYGRSYAVTDEEYLQQSLEPPDRLTRKELNQLRAIREEIESRPRITRFEKRYVRLLIIAEENFCGVKLNSSDSIYRVRRLLKDTEQASTTERKSIAIAFLTAAIAVT